MATPNFKWMSMLSVRDNKTMKEVKCRSPFQRGYGAIIHSSQFRRLSHKTQVHLNPNFDYVRSRLTHSLEVSQIGRQLARLFCEYLGVGDYISNDGVTRDFRNDFEDLTAAACLAHDIGQAPFGHAGEKKLSELMKEYGLAFDANKQNVRLLLGSDMRPSLNVPYSLVDSIMKYKSEDIFSDKGGAFYNDEKEIVKKILENTETGSVRHPACYLMECADDIGYICGDIEDGIKHNLLPANRVIELLSPFEILGDEYQVITNENWKNIVENNWNAPNVISSYLMKALIDHSDNIIKSFNLKQVDKDNIPKYLNEQIAKIQNTKEAHNLLYCSEQSNPSLATAIKNLKDEVYHKHILKSSKVVEAEYISQKIIESLFAEFMTLSKIKDCKKIEKTKLFGLFPTHVQDKIKNKIAANSSINEAELARMVCDYVSGMTDRYAIYFWEKMNGPSILKAVS